MLKKAGMCTTLLWNKIPFKEVLLNNKHSNNEPKHKREKLYC